MLIHLKVAERHLPYGITHCLPTQVNVPRLNLDPKSNIVTVKRCGKVIF